MGKVSYMDGLEAIWVHHGEKIFYCTQKFKDVDHSECERVALAYFAKLASKKKELKASGYDQKYADDFEKYRNL